MNPITAAIDFDGEDGLVMETEAGGIEVMRVADGFEIYVQHDKRDAKILLSDEDARAIGEWLVTNR